MDAIINSALGALAGFPRIDKHVFSNRANTIISQAVQSSWPDLPPQLVVYLFLASDPSLPARQVLVNLESLFELLEEVSATAGAWKARAKRLMQDGSPRRDARYNHYGAFYSTLFEFNLWLRMSRSPYVVEFHSNKKLGPDITVKNSNGQRLCAVEAYAPQRSTEKDFSEQEEDWRLFVSGGRISFRTSATFSIPLTALPEALRTIMSEDHFERKRAQLAMGNLPTLLAIRPWSLTRLGLSTLLPHMTGLDCDSFSSDVFAGLPSQCLGILLCFFTLTGTETIEFWPRPGRPPGEDIERFFTTLDIIATEGGGT